MRRILGRVLIVGAIVIAAGITWLIVGRLTAPTVDGIPCVSSEQLNYHVHAHLSIIDGGKQYTIPGNTGISLLHLCLFWLHTHDDSGIIHIEAPHRITPTLGQFFDIWGQPLSRTHVARFTVSPGQSMRVYVGTNLYRGNPRAITLHAHTIVTIEVGPPFIPVPRVNWNGL
jgi:hypothetical protein